MIIATAGHIDHGKTSLIKALTGTDTDRLPEEKARGISIDLGFAYLPLGNGQLLGFVDVPGHERFVRNMLAGVCAIDYALLVVAADDGPMPQTHEHLNILALLNVTRGAVVISKTDRVAQTRVQEVGEQMGAMLDGVFSERFPILPVSMRSGAGIDALRSLLTEEAARQVARRASGQHFRFAIDRAFVLSGAGTVVTGTVFNGQVKANDKVLVSGHDEEVRVRSIQIHGSPASAVDAGQRCALNLSGVHIDTVGRGDWVLDPAIHNPGARMDVRISLIQSESQPLRHWTPVHLHMGSADVTARIVVSGGKSIAPGTSAFAQIILSRPVCALRLDRFILRDQSATRTLGGGVVLDPLAGPLRRRDPSYPARPAALEKAAEQSAFSELVGILDDGVDLDWFEKICGLTQESADYIYAQTDLLRIGKTGRFGMSPARYAALRKIIVEAVMQSHLGHSEAGKEVDLLRKSLAPTMSPDIFQWVMRELVGTGDIAMVGARAQLPGHGPSTRPDDDTLWQAVGPVLDAAEFMPPPAHQLAVQLGLHDDVLLNFLGRMAGMGKVVKVTPDRFYPRGTLATMAALARAMAKASPDGSFTVAQYRDASGAGRQAVINVLEFFDGLGITHRVGGARRLGRDYVPIFGSGAPVTALPARAARPEQEGQCSHD